MKRVLAALFAWVALACAAQVGGPVIGQGGVGSSGGTFTGPILMPDGAVGTPSAAFASAPTTGFYKLGAGIAYASSGTFGGSWNLNQWLAAGVGGTDLGSATFSFKRLYVDFTNTGTVGAVTISKASGRVNIAAAGTSIVVTNTLVTAAAHVMAVASTNDATCWVKSVVPAAGSFTLTTNAACTAQTSFDFFLINAD